MVPILTNIVIKVLLFISSSAYRYFRMVIEIFELKEIFERGQRNFQNAHKKPVEFPT